ncbi:MAG: hypothetical protein FIB08_07730 [Candidatus Methanoperedens sp.]|nr:hypothetical protein [Candidatus Methanoperedens sp.]
MNTDMSTETTEKLRNIDEGLKYLAELDLLDVFYDKIWKKKTGKLLGKYIEHTDTGIGTSGKLRNIDEGLRYLAEHGLLDTFYDDIWKNETGRLLDKYIDQSTYRDLPLEETDGVKRQVFEWFGEDYGLAEINGKLWMVAVGSVDEGGNKWWYKIKLNTDDLETARKVILFDKCMPGKYCNLYITHQSPHTVRVL